MSTELRAGPVSYLVLGIVALRGPSTPYDLKRFVQLSIGHFWPFPHTQLYAEPARLAELGLLEETREETGRRRKHYSITESGREVLAEWLGEPVTNPTEYRDLGLLKLFFGSLLASDDIASLARAQVAAHETANADLEKIRAHVESVATPAQLATLELGLRWNRTAADFWAEVESDPPA